MTAAKHGTLAEFDAGIEDWKSYAERLEQYFVANDITDAGKQRVVLLSGCGAATYKLIRNLVAPAKPLFSATGGACDEAPQPQAISNRPALQI